MSPAGPSVVQKMASLVDLTGAVDEVTGIECVLGAPACLRAQNRCPCTFHRRCVRAHPFPMQLLY